MAINIPIDVRARGQEFLLNFGAMALIFVSGIIMAITFFVMSSVHTAFLSAQCDIPSNTIVTTCQEWFNLALFPVLNLRYVLVYASYFFIFGIVFGLFYMGYKTRKHPVLIVVHILTSVILGYLAIEMSNIYRTLISNSVMYDILVPFAIYNRIMLYFPQFIFFTIFISGLIGFMGVFKSAGQYNEGVEDLA